MLAYVQKVRIIVNHMNNQDNINPVSFSLSNLVFFKDFK
jgi:hypothetical protein